MKKLIAFVSGAVLLTAGVASAATFTNVQFSNGQTTTDCTAGASVNVEVRVSVPAGETVEIMQADVLGDNLAPMQPVDVGGTLGVQEGISTVSLAVKCPQNTGYYNLEIRGAGIFGGQRSISITDGVQSVNSFSNAIRVVSTGSNTGGSTGGQSFKDQFCAAFPTFPGCGATAPAPVPATDAACAAFTAANAGTQPNVYSDANVALQGFLLSQHMSIPALKAGAAFGFYGNQTTNALGIWRSQHSTCV